MRSTSVIAALFGLAAASPMPSSHKAEADAGAVAAPEPKAPAPKAAAPKGAAPKGAAPKGQAPKAADQGPFHFTSTYNLVATPDQVIDEDEGPVPGEAGAMGYYNYGINSELDIICYVRENLPLLSIFSATNRVFK